MSDNAKPATPKKGGKLKKMLMIGGGALLLLGGAFLLLGRALTGLVGG